jgi:hypothetical protein
MFKKVFTAVLAGVVLFGLTACDPLDIIESWGVALKELASGDETDGDEMKFDEDGNLVLDADNDDWTGDLGDFDEAMGAITAAQEAEEAAAQAEEEEVDVANYQVTTGEEGDGELAEFYGEMLEEEEGEEEWEPPVFESGTYGLIGTMYIELSSDPVFDSYMRCLDGVNKKYVHHYDYCDATWGPFDGEFDNIFWSEMIDCMNSDPDFREDADNCWLNYAGEWGVGVGGF